MAASTKVAPWLYDDIQPYLAASAIAAAAQCDGGSDGVTCGTKWTTNGVWDGTYGVGQQMSALEVIQSNLITTVKGPVTNNTGGTSAGNPKYVIAPIYSYTPQFNLSSTARVHRATPLLAL